ncbi:U3 small nucleolar RNA-associated protein 15 [Rhodotorula toruloides]|uniref:BY PROTMAP: gi/472581380/gb/EMS19119.1/ U3 small nucleolar RNA-associated protein 15 [Rhodosporidium toruloides NP11] gi/647395432/emb/CDR36842.1/ RHTO0S02e07536g1_1 [Rhodosporidium toruloides] n=1 Tax=Rhodotorula toruloides TaxID=5286 RepID=A0A0K3CIS0_RHOTO|nr:U3 small nucleolar RNA-associated protein 15 [Rhodotorula toruloides]PRQ73233.1 WD40-repeat-containing domain protein [Rhodotorula toruloides]
MADFSRLVVPKAAKTVVENQQQKESVYWRSFKSPVFLKSYAPITHVHFSPSHPHRYVVTSGTRLQIYSPKTNRVVKTIARFKETATSGEIRTDGKLCVAGDEGGLVQVFDINSRAILRTIRAHKQAVHTTKFSPGPGTQILTTSSDTTVRLFDLSTSAPLRTFSSHSDYVRTASFVPSSPSLIFSGGYDSTVRLWDARVPDSEGSGCVWIGRHGKPVDQVLVGEQGTMAVSAGGPILRVWDLLGASTSRSSGAGAVMEGGDDAATGKEEEEVDTGTAYCLKALSNHQKSIMALCWAEAENGEKRVLSGGLDGLVKVYDPQENWRVRHTMRYGGQVMSLAVSPNNSHLVAGLSDGSLSIRTRAGVGRKAGVPVESVTPSYDAILAGMGHGGVVYSGKQAGEGLRATFEGETKVTKERRKKLSEWDRMLKNFRYGDALDSVMRRDVTPATAFALMEELIRRDGLAIALANRTDVSLEPVLSFLVKHITDPRYCVLAADVASVLIDIYTPTLGLSPLIDTLFTRLRRKLDDELDFHRELTMVQGALDMVFASSAQPRA